MRSVVVVLPASMWAMMPMLRVFSSEYCRSTSSPAFFLFTWRASKWPPTPPALVASRQSRDASRSSGGAFLRNEEGGQPSAPLLVESSLPAVMRERFVGLRHLVRVFSLLDGR